MKIITLGKGFISEHLPYERNTERFTPDASNDLKLLSKGHPDVIVNCIGRTGKPNIDWCQDHKEETFIQNTILPLRIAETCKFAGIRLIQLASGCIFSGSSTNLKADSSVQFDAGRGYIPYRDLGWKESDPANPVSYYSKTKYATDLLLEDLPNVISLRIRMPVSSKNLPRNLLSKLKGYQKVIDEPNSITSMDDLVRCVDWAAKNDLNGIYHITNPEPTTAAEIMREYQKHRSEHKFETMTVQELDRITVAKRSNCILNTDKLKKAGFTMTPTQEAVEKAVKEYVTNGG